MLKISTVRIPDGLQTKLNQLIDLSSLNNPMMQNDSDKKGMKRKMANLVKVNLKKRNGSYKTVATLLNGLIKIERVRLSFDKLLNKFDEYKLLIAENVPAKHQNRLLSGIWTHTLNYAFSAGEEAAIELMDKIIQQNAETIAETIKDKSEEE